MPPVAEPEIKTPLPVIASCVIAKPPMFPVVALILPVTDTEPENKADEAVTSPFAFTLNLLELIKNSLFCADPEIKNPEPVIASRVIAKPPMLPVVAFMLPVTLTEPLNNADEAVTSPFALTLNLLELIKKSFPVAEPDI